MKNSEEQNFQFILYINENIICQRSFNVTDYNEDVAHSIELKELMDRVTSTNNGYLGIIPKYLQKESIKYLWEIYPFISTQENSKNVNLRNDSFQFEIKVNNQTLAKSEFSADYFPPKVKYSVDVREIVKDIVIELKDYLSRPNYTITKETKRWLQNKNNLKKKYRII